MCQYVSRLDGGVKRLEFREGFFWVRENVTAARGAAVERLRANAPFAAIAGGLEFGGRGSRAPSNRPPLRPARRQRLFDRRVKGCGVDVGAAGEKVDEAAPRFRIGVNAGVTLRQ